MKLIFFNSTRAWGGGEKWHLEMAGAMARKGHEVVIMAGKDTELSRRARRESLRCTEIHVTNLSFLNILKAFWLVRYFKKTSPGTIILNLSADLKLAGMSAWIAGIPDIVYRRGSAIPIRDKWFNRFLFSRVITRIIANSEETKRTILQHNPHLFPPQKISVIYNGLLLDDREVPHAMKGFKKHQDEVIIGNAGRLVQQKGQHYLIRIASRLQSHNLPFRIVIAGEGPLERELKQLAIEEQVADKIIFCGFTEHIQAFMESIDVFVLTSLWEGFGYVLAEAMAARKPVVAFRVSSNPEIVLHEETGFLTGMGDTEAMGECIMQLAHDPSLRSIMGQKGRERVEQLFDIRKTEDRLEEFLQTSS